VCVCRAQKWRTCSIRRGWSPSRRRACSSGRERYRKGASSRARYTSASRRSEGPFVAVNCAAILKILLRIRTVRARKGSFTGAIYDHKGLVLLRTEGRCSWMRSAICLLLCSQALAVLQDREVRAVGATQGTAVGRADHLRHAPRPRRPDESRAVPARTLHVSTSSRSFSRPLGAARRHRSPATHYLGVTAGRYGKDVRAFAPERSDAPCGTLAGQRAPARQRDRASGLRLRLRVSCPPHSYSRR